MDKYNEWLKRKNELAEAKERLGFLGKPEPHLGKNNCGNLHSVKVSTSINFQSYSGAKNYHDDAAFDAALECVIRERFSELAELAIKRMELKTREAAANALLEYDQLKSAAEDVTNGQQ